MPRTIVYDSPRAQVHYESLRDEFKHDQSPSLSTTILNSPILRMESIDLAAHGAEVPPGGQDPAAAPTKDDYLAKIAKYVPAETITLTVAFFAAFTPTRGSVWYWVAAGAVLNVLYLFSVAVQSTSPGARPRPYFYLLSALAYVLWTMATVNAVETKAGITTDSKQLFILVLAAFVVPALDTILGSLRIGLRVLGRK